ncbi:Uncharacterized protein CLAVI_000079 [Candidatus Clavichlamydia salmonicola]|uniref:DUF4339 domain-containing protein n=1 Tax=Candidatus Clavichlamydia salmonicola TaxID=469812 RepID=UPI001890CDDE|nr:DUF4339 domain-containing protein [Candidatus Clavichlamydia salmonicola]MBF5050474.1 Uncharacterized protein [Candidatus Clavichlamydia salmonicola]
MQTYLSPFSQFFLLLFSFCLQITFGITAAYIATKKRRHVLLWFILGMFFGIIGIFFLILLPTKDEYKIQLQDLPQRCSDILTKYSDSTPPKFPNVNDLWFYGKSPQSQSGPLSLQELIEALQKEDNLKDIFVWKKGMKVWKKLSFTPEVMLQMPKNQNSNQ